MSASSSDTGLPLIVKVLLALAMLAVLFVVVVDVLQIFKTI